MNYSLTLIGYFVLISPKRDFTPPCLSASDLADEAFSSYKQVDLCLFVPWFPSYFHLLISLGKNGLIILLLNSGPTLDPLRVVPVHQSNC